MAVDDAPGMESTDVSVRLRSDLPVVAERSMYFGYHGVDGGHVSTGSTEPSAQWYFAEGYTAGSFDEYILILNPETTDAYVTLDYLKPDGSVTSQYIVVGANSRATVAVDGGRDLCLLSVPGLSLPPAPAASAPVPGLDSPAAPCVYF